MPKISDCEGECLSGWRCKTACSRILLRSYQEIPWSHFVCHGMTILKSANHKKTTLAGGFYWWARSVVLRFFIKKSFVLSALVRRMTAHRHTPVCLSLDSELPFSGVLTPQRKPQKNHPCGWLLLVGAFGCPTLFYKKKTSFYRRSFAV